MFGSWFQYFSFIFVPLTFLWIVQKILRDIKINNLNQRYVLITGCDTGFGYRAAKTLDAMGVNVFACCLTKQSMTDLSANCSKRLVPVHLDVTDDLSILQAHSAVEEHLPAGQGLWGLVNNAGIVGANGCSEWMTKTDFETTININLLGTVSVTKTFLPLLRLAGGRVVNTASVVGRFAFPPAPYTVSKYCVEAYTDVLRREMASLGVSVHTVEPGGYQTNITDSNLTIANMKKTYHQCSEDVKTYYGFNYVNKLVQLARPLCWLLACPRLYEVVDTYVHALTAKYPKTRYCVGLNGNFLFRPLWTLPSWIADFIFGMSYPLPEKYGMQ